MPRLGASALAPGINPAVGISTTHGVVPDEWLGLVRWLVILMLQGLPKKDCAYSAILPQIIAENACYILSQLIYECFNQDENECKVYPCFEFVNLTLVSISLAVKNVGLLNYDNPTLTLGFQLLQQILPIESWTKNVKAENGSMDVDKKRESLQTWKEYGMQFGIQWQSVELAALSKIKWNVNCEFEWDISSNNVDTDSTNCEGRHPKKFTYKAFLAQRYATHKVFR